MDVEKNILIFDRFWLFGVIFSRSRSDRGHGVAQAACYHPCVGKLYVFQVTMDDNGVPTYFFKIAGFLIYIYVYILDLFWTTTIFVHRSCLTLVSLKDFCKWLINILELNQKHVIL